MANTFGRHRRSASCPATPRSRRTASARGAAAYTFGRRCRSASPPATPRSPARSLRGTQRLNTFGRRHRSVSCPATPRGSLATSARGAATPHLAVRRLLLGISLVTKKILRNFCAGRGGQYLRPSSSGRSGTSSFRPPSVARYLAGDKEVPAWPPRGARRPIPSAVTIKVQRHLILPPALRRQASRR